MNKKVVTREHYGDVLRRNGDRTYTLTLRGWQVAILHGLVALAADHPGIKAMHGPTHQTIFEVRNWCKTIFAGWGFAPDEVEYLDAMRV